MKTLRHNQVKLVFTICCTVIGACVRMYNLGWGPYYFHPDEHNIAHSISQLRFPDQMHPDFFVYGSFPIYVAYGFGKLLVGDIDPQTAVMIARLISAIASTATIPLIYMLAKTLLRSTSLAMIGAFLSVFLTGFIQYAHFATFESIVTFLYCAIAYCSIRYVTTRRKKDILLVAVMIGLAMGTRINNAYLLGLPFLLAGIHRYRNPVPGLRSFLQEIELHRILLDKHAITAVVLAGAVFVLTNPYAILDFPWFIASLASESNIATGVRPVFFTRSFLDTIPGVFQLTQVLPYISGIPFTIAGVLGGIVIVWKEFRTDTHSFKTSLPLVYIFGMYALLTFTLFVKWTRYVVPFVPFLIIGVLVVLDVVKKAAARRIIPAALFWVLTVALLLDIGIRGLLFFSIYTRIDPRVQASQWLFEHIQPDEQILVQDKDPNAILFWLTFPEQTTFFNFYALSGTLDEANTTQATSLEQLAHQLTQTDWIVVPSQRIYASALRLPEHFPHEAAFFGALFERKLGFVQTVQTPPHPLSADNAEETFTVYDYPTITMWHKQHPYSAAEYEKILRNPQEH